MKKILIFGFPHCGTSILKSIISHCDNVLDLIQEGYIFPECIPDCIESCVVKYPYTTEHFFNSEYYQDVYKVFIIRNPVFSISSINKRFATDKIPHNHSLHYYEEVVQHFIHQTGEKLYKIKYEDIFYNDFKRLKIILEHIGLSYSEDIFDNSKYVNKVNTFGSIPTIQPDNLNHVDFRNWQINQPIKNMNAAVNINLTEDQITFLKNNKIINSIYNIDEYLP